MNRGALFEELAAWLQTAPEPGINQGRPHSILMNKHVTAAHLSFGTGQLQFRYLLNEENFIMTDPQIAAKVKEYFLHHNAAADF